MTYRYEDLWLDTVGEGYNLPMKITRVTKEERTQKEKEKIETMKVKNQ